MVVKHVPNQRGSKTSEAYRPKRIQKVGAGEGKRRPPGKMGSVWGPYRKRTVTTNALGKMGTTHQGKGGGVILQNRTSKRERNLFDRTAENRTSMTEQLVKTFSIQKKASLIKTSQTTSEKFPKVSMVYVRNPWSEGGEAKIRA